MSKWVDRLENIKTMLSNGYTLEFIGAKYGVSKQRLYQILRKYNINTPNKKKKSFLKGKEPKFHWLNTILVNKKFNKEERLALLINMSIPDYCPVLGIKLNYDGTGKEGYSHKDNSPSIDRIDSSKGYTMKNIAIISWRANRLKSDGTAVEHLRIYQWLNEIGGP